MKRSIFLTFAVFLLIAVNYTIAQPPVRDGVPSTIPVPTPKGETTIPTTPSVETPTTDQIENILNPSEDDDDRARPVGDEGDEDERNRQIGLGKGVGVQFDSIGIFGHDYLRTNNFPYYKTVEDVNVSDDYILGPGDFISVNLWADNDIQSDGFRISKDGYVQQQEWGRLYLQGLTYGKAKDLMRERYQKFYNFDTQDFDVSLTGSRIINVDIVGDVEIPGSYRVPAVNTVYNVLKLSGGPTANGSVRNIQIKRAGNVIETLDVYQYLNNAKNRQNIYLEDNDVIYIPQIGKVVEVDGAIKKNTKFELKPNEQFNSLLYFAGGFRPNALKTRIQLFRYENDEYVLRDFSYNPKNPSSTNPELYDGDVISVKEIPAEANNIVTVEGAINQPGYYEFQSGIKVSDLINKANGIRFDAVTEKAYLTRYDEKLQATNIALDLAEIINNPSGEENITLFPKDHLQILSKSSFASEYPVQIFGKVKSPGRFKFGSKMTLQDLLILSGGFETDALIQKIELRRVIGYDEVEGRNVPIRDLYKTIDVDYNFLTSSKGNSQIELRPYDQIFVRAVPDFNVPRTVVIKGEVVFPGHYPLENKGMKISDLIERSGGTTAYAYRTGAKFYRDETIRVRDFSDSLRVGYKDSLLTRKNKTSLKLGNNDFVKIAYKDSTIRSLVVVDLDEVKRNNNSPYNYVLKPGDELFIPPVDEVVTIRGAIRNMVNDTTIINTAFVGEKNAKWYINNYGAGFGKDAWRRTTQVVYPNGQAQATRKFLFFNIYPEVVPGSDIVIDNKPPREEKSRFFEGLNAEKTLAILGSMVTTTGLIIALSNRN